MALDFITFFNEPWEALGFGGWAVCIKNIEPGKSGSSIGYCTFIPEQIEGAGPELAYAMGKSMWGKGLVTEAMTACLEWIFTKPGISRVYGVTDRDNAASRRVMEKLGMSHEKDVDLYDSVARGEGLLPFYAIERESYLQKVRWKLEDNCRAKSRVYDKFPKYLLKKFWENKNKNRQKDQQKQYCPQEYPFF